MYASCVRDYAKHDNENAGRQHASNVLHGSGWQGHPLAGRMCQRHAASTHSLCVDCLHYRHAPSAVAEFMQGSCTHPCQYPSRPFHACASPSSMPNQRTHSCPSATQPTNIHTMQFKHIHFTHIHAQTLLLILTEAFPTCAVLYLPGPSMG